MRQSGHWPARSAGASDLRTLPPVARRALDDWIAAQHRVIGIEFDAALRVVAVFADSGDAPVLDISPGDDIVDVAPYLYGQFGEEAELRFVTDPNGVHLHVRIVSHAGRSFALLQDAGEAHANVQRLQQRSNDNALLLARQRRLLSELIDARAEVDQRRREAEDDGRRKSEYIATMSHDFRNPMTAVLLQAEQLLGDEVSRDDVLQAAAAIRRIVGHQVQLIDNLLEQARSEVQGIDIQEGAVDLRALLDDISLVVAPLASEKTLSLAIRVSDDVAPYLRLDESKLRRIVVNLVGNAIKFTDEGRVDVVAALQDDKLRLAVRDTGPGISAPDRQRIFLAFDRLADVRSRPGAGLGLAISRRLAEAMGGALTLDCPVDGGSCFTLSLPYAPVVAVPVDRGAQVEAGSATEILVVDDDPDICDLLALHLESAGHRVRTAVDAEAALHAVQALPPGLVISDINLPGIGGLALVRELRERGHGMPVLALSAANLGRTRRTALGAGFNDFIAKPVSRRTLLNKVASLLANAALSEGGEPNR